MGMIINLAKLAVPLLAVAYVLGGPKLAFDNGFAKMLEACVKSAKLPGSSDALIVHWTGFEPIDSFLALMISFFYPIIDGKNPRLSLLGFHFAGQLSTIWLLMCLESFRVGNAWRMISFITFWGVAMEAAGAGVIVPAYFSLHLLTSPTARSPTTLSQPTRKAILLIHPSELRVLPWSTAIGHFVPVAFSLYFSTKTTSPIWESSQFWIVIRLLHPLWTAAIHLFLSMSIRSGELMYTSSTQRNRDVLRALQGVYTYAMFIAAVPHVATLALSAGSYIFPSLFSLEAQAAFHPLSLLRPVYFWESSKFTTTNVATGTFDFLQWDEIASIAAPLIWAFALNRQSVSKEPSASSFLYTTLKTVLVTAVGGPAAATISLIKERDQVVLDLPDLVEETKSM